MSEKESASVIESRRESIRRVLDNLKQEVKNSPEQETQIEKRKNEMAKLVEECKASIGFSEKSTLSDEQKEKWSEAACDWDSFPRRPGFGSSEFKKKFQKELSHDQQIEFIYHQASTHAEFYANNFHNRIDNYCEMNLPVLDIIKLIIAEEYIKYGEVKLDVFNLYCPWIHDAWVSIYKGCSLRGQHIPEDSYYEVLSLATPFTDPDRIWREFQCGLLKESDRPEVKEIIRIANQKDPDYIADNYYGSNEKLLDIAAQDSASASKLFYNFERLIGYIQKKDPEAETKFKKTLETAAKNIPAREQEKTTPLVEIILNTPWESKEALLEEIKKVVIKTDTKTTLEHIKNEGTGSPDLIILNFPINDYLAYFPLLAQKIKESLGDDLGEKVVFNILKEKLQPFNQLKGISLENDLAIRHLSNDSFYKDIAKTIQKAKNEEYREITVKKDIGKALDPEYITKIIKCSENQLKEIQTKDYSEEHHREEHLRSIKPYLGKAVRARQKEKSRLLKKYNKNLGFNNKDKLSLDKKVDLVWTFMKSHGVGIDGKNDFSKFEQSFLKLSPQERKEAVHSIFNMEKRQYTWFLLPESFEFLQKNCPKLGEIIALTLTEDYVEDGGISFPIFDYFKDIKDFIPNALDLLIIAAPYYQIRENLDTWVNEPDQEKVTEILKLLAIKNDDKGNFVINFPKYQHLPKALEIIELGASNPKTAPYVLANIEMFVTASDDQEKIKNIIKLAAKNDPIAGDHKNLLKTDKNNSSLDEAWKTLENIKKNTIKEREKSKNFDDRDLYVANFHAYQQIPGSLNILSRKLLENKSYMNREKPKSGELSLTQIADKYLEYMYSHSIWKPEIYKNIEKNKEVQKNKLLFFEKASLETKLEHFPLVNKDLDQEDKVIKLIEKDIKNCSEPYKLLIPNKDYLYFLGPADNPTGYAYDYDKELIGKIIRIICKLDPQGVNDHMVEIEKQLPDRDNEIINLIKTELDLKNLTELDLKNLDKYSEQRKKQSNLEVPLLHFDKLPFDYALEIFPQYYRKLGKNKASIILNSCIKKCIESTENKTQGMFSDFWEKCYDDKFGYSEEEKDFVMKCMYEAKPFNFVDNYSRLKLEDRYEEFEKDFLNRAKKLLIDPDKLKIDKYFAQKEKKQNLKIPNDLALLQTNAFNAMVLLPNLCGGENIDPKKAEELINLIREELTLGSDVGMLLGEGGRPRIKHGLPSSYNEKQKKVIIRILMEINSDRILECFPNLDPYSQVTIMDILFKEYDKVLWWENIKSIIETNYGREKIAELFGNYSKNDIKEILIACYGIEESEVDKLFPQAAQKEFSFFTPEKYKNKSYLDISCFGQYTIIDKPNENKFLHSLLVDMFGKGGKAGLIIKLLEKQGFNPNIFHDGDKIWIKSGVFCVQRVKDKSIEKVTLYCSKEELDSINNSSWSRNNFNTGEEKLAQEARSAALDELLNNIPNIDEDSRDYFKELFLSTSFSLALETLPKSSPTSVHKLETSKNQLRCLAKTTPNFILQNIETLSNTPFFEKESVELIIEMEKIPLELFWGKFEFIKEYALNNLGTEYQHDDGKFYRLLSVIFLKISNQEKGVKNIFQNLTKIKECIKDEDLVTILKHCAYRSPITALNPENLSQYIDLSNSTQIIDTAISNSRSNHLMSVFVSAPLYYRTHQKKLDSKIIEYPEKAIEVLLAQEVINTWNKAGLGQVRENFLQRANHELLFKNEVYATIKNNPKKKPSELQKDPTLVFYPYIQDSWITTNNHFETQPRLKLRFNPSRQPKGKGLNSPESIQRRKLLIARYWGLRNKNLAPSDLTPEMAQEADYKIFEARQKKYANPIFKGRNVIGYFPSGALGINFSNLERAITDQQTNENEETSGTYLDFRAGSGWHKTRERIINTDPPLTFITHKHSATSTIEELKYTLIQRWKRLTKEGVEPSEENKDFIIIGGCFVTAYIRDTLCKAMKEKGYPIPDIVSESEYGQGGFADEKDQEGSKLGSPFLDLVVFNEDPSTLSTFGTMWENRDKNYNKTDSEENPILRGNTTFLSTDDEGILFQLATNESNEFDDFSTETMNA